MMRGACALLALGGVAGETRTLNWSDQGSRVQGCFGHGSSACGIAAFQECAFAILLGKLQAGQFQKLEL